MNYLGQGSAGPTGTPIRRRGSTEVNPARFSNVPPQGLFPRAFAKSITLGFDGKTPPRAGSVPLRVVFAVLKDVDCAVLTRFKKN